MKLFSAKHKQHFNTEITALDNTFRLKYIFNMYHNLSKHLQSASGRITTQHGTLREKNEISMRQNQSYFSSS